MMTIAEIEKVLHTLRRKKERQNYALEDTTRQIKAWEDLRTAKEKETKK